MAKKCLNEVTTGVENQNSSVPVEADCYAYADDGEHAVVWAVTRNNDHEVTVTMWVCEAGLADRDTAYGTKQFDVPADEQTSTWARSYAEHHKDSIAFARDYWD